MSLECTKVHATLIKAGFFYLGSCGTCPQRIKRYTKGKFVIKTYGYKCFLKLFESNKEIKNGDHTKIEELIQATIQENQSTG
jgi:hypothetical protein